MSDTSPEQFVEKTTQRLADEEDFLTEPLVGLTERPTHLMSDDELREHVIYLRTMRQSFQTYKAEVEKKESPKVKRERAEAKPKKDEFKDFDF